MRLKKNRRFKGNRIDRKNIMTIPTSMGIEFLNEIEHHFYRDTNLIPLNLEPYETEN